jgi:hypothetical protein
MLSSDRNQEAPRSIQLMKNETFTHKGESWQRIPARAFEHWVIGVDPGGVSDYTAICAVHYVVEPLPEPFIVNHAGRTIKQRVCRTFSVHGLTRLPLGLTMPQQADRLQAIRSARPQLRGADIAIDVTGLGSGFADVCSERGMRPLVRIVFSAGDTVNRLKADRLSVPKLQLIGALDGAVQNGELQVAPSVSGADLLIREAENFKRAITAAGRSQVNARENEHDDLICSLSMACWWAKRRQGNQARAGNIRGTVL